MDKVNFLKLAQDGSLLPLDGDNAAKLGAAVKPELGVKAKTEDVPEEHVYGVDISGSPLLEGISRHRQRIHRGHQGQSERPDNAFKFISRYLE